MQCFSYWESLIAGVTLADSFIFAMGMIVAFVPEGMLPTVTLSLAMGVQRMADRHALIKRLSAVETLGCTTVICTDKTGTLTQNEMTVRDLWLVGRRLNVTGAGYTSSGQILEGGKQPVIFNAVEKFEKDLGTTDQDVEKLLIAAGLCNNSRLLPPNEESSQWTILGDPTEAALLVAAQKANINLDEASRLNPRLRELPFDSRRKRMSTIHRGQEGNLVFVKGAPREVLALCTHVQQNSKVLPIDESLREQINAANDEYALNGLRVLAVAWRRLPDSFSMKEQSSNHLAEKVEDDLTFLGLVAMMDPPRPEVSEAVEKCHTAGIRIIMITGDYGLTAETIARRIGIIRSPNPHIVTGIDLDSMDETALQDALSDEIIFARVAPEHKLRVVTTLKQMGEIVAVTGDGVNDAPALKKADIGVAMGVAGTDVAREAGRYDPHRRQFCFDCECGRRRSSCLCEHP